MSELSGLFGISGRDGGLGIFGIDCFKESAPGILDDSPEIDDAFGTLGGDAPIEDNKDPPPVGVILELNVKLDAGGKLGNDGDFNTGMFDILWIDY